MRLLLVFLLLFSTNALADKQQILRAPNASALVSLEQATAKATMSLIAGKMGSLFK